MITVQTAVHAPLRQVWSCFTDPKHIIHWNFATPEWHCPTAENTLEAGGSFCYHMAAKDGSFGFDLKGTFSFIEPHAVLNYSLEDGRKVEVLFQEEAGTVKVIQRFEPEQVHAQELQQQGWQAILNQFGRYVHSLSSY